MWCFASECIANPVGETSFDDIQCVKFHPMPDAFCLCVCYLVCKNDSAIFQTNLSDWPDYGIVLKIYIYFFIFSEKDQNAPISNWKRWKLWVKLPPAVNVNEDLHSSR